MKLAESGSDHLLWHLEALGVVDLHNSSPIWREIEKRGHAPVRVALLETGVDTAHPNLLGAIDMEAQADFSSHHYGTLYQPDIAGVRRPRSGGREARRRAEQAAANDQARNLFNTEDTRLMARLERRGVRVPDTVAPVIEALEHPNNRARPLAIEDPARALGFHGTACAGLIGARIPPRRRWRSQGIPPLPYSGVNPYCTILPISTPVAFDARAALHALIYAVAKGAEIIAIPRNAPTGPNSKIPKADLDRYQSFLEAVAEKIYVVTATLWPGSAEDRRYPAWLAPKVSAPGFLMADHLKPIRETEETPGAIPIFGDTLGDAFRSVSVLDASELHTRTKLPRGTSQARSILAQPAAHRTFFGSCVAAALLAGCVSLALQLKPADARGVTERKALFSEANTLGLSLS